jgi:hypothetical protein
MLEVWENSSDQARIEVAQSEIRWALAQPLLGERQQQAERVLVCGDCVRAGLPIAAESLGEKGL